MLPLSLAGLADLHPFVPADQAEGYRELIDELSKDLATITGMDAVSLQPNSGANGEYSGLMGNPRLLPEPREGYRNVALIPASAHGTNPASAAMAGMRIVTVACDTNGNIDIDDLRAKAGRYASELCCIMVTYPSTHGVFESRIREIVDIVHDNGGQVYMDGANMNAQVGLTNPGYIGADVCHLNLHKTFAIPHGGGGRASDRSASRSIWPNSCRAIRWSKRAAKTESLPLRRRRSAAPRFCRSPTATSKCLAKAACDAPPKRRSCRRITWHPL